MAVEKQMIPGEMDIEGTAEVEVEVVNPEMVGVEVDGDQFRVGWCVPGGETPAWWLLSPSFR